MENFDGKHLYKL